MRILTLVTLMILSVSFSGMERQRTYEVISDTKSKFIRSGKCVLKGRAINVSTDQYVSGLQIKDYHTGEVLDVTDKDGCFKLRLDSGMVALSVDGDNYNKNSFSVYIKSRHEKVIRVFMRDKDHPITTRKPVIYLYPEEKKQVSVKVDFVGEMTFTYPEYNDGWQATASPDGSIECDGKSYNYLFWEGDQPQFMDRRDVNKGFVVSSDEVVTFLEEKLTRVGFNDKEINDFITFWGPVLTRNKWNYIHFLFNNEYSEFISEMSIQPQPDNMIRLYMAFQPLDEPVDVIQQSIPTVARNGFTVVEWGGGEVLALPSE